MTAEYHSTLIETAYNDALEGVACGLTRDETRGAIFDRYPSLSQDEIGAILTDALRDARKQGVEREDIDESWF